MSTSDAPLSDAPWPTAPPGAPGLKVGFPGAHELASPSHRLSHRAKLLLLVAGLGLLTLTLVVVALLATPGPPPNCSPLSCQGPPIGHRIGQIAVENAHGNPIVDGTLYQNSQGFTVRYPPQPSVQTDAQGIELTYDFNTGGPSSIEILGVPSGGATPQSAVEGFAGQEFPNTQSVYELPNPLIGYQPAYGVAFNVQPASSDGSTGTDQVVVAAAVHNGFAIVVQVVGALQPTVDSNSPFFNGHPSPAGTNLAYFVGDFIVDRIGFP